MLVVEVFQTADGRWDYAPVGAVDNRCVPGHFPTRASAEADALLTVRELVGSDPILTYEDGYGVGG